MRGIDKDDFLDQRPYPIRDLWNARLLTFDPDGFEDTRSALTLALDKARELRLRHAHWIGPVLRQPAA
jgi:hypothetical protein